MIKNTQREYDDANGCPCDGAYSCQCSCTGCTCRTDPNLWGSDAPGATGDSNESCNSGTHDI